MKWNVMSCVLGAMALSLALPSSRAAEAASPEGWFLAGSHRGDYETGTDPAVHHTGSGSGFLKAKPTASPAGFGTLMQMVSAEKYRGKRVRLSGWVKANGVTDWAGLWMRVDGQDGSLAFDNMQDRPIRGTHEWKRFEVVLDVADGARGIAFGILLAGGKGQVWLDDVQLEVVAAEVPTTGGEMSATTHAQPQNLGFDK